MTLNGGGKHFDGIVLTITRDVIRNVFGVNTGKLGPEQIEAELMEPSGHIRLLYFPVDIDVLIKKGDETFTMTKVNLEAHGGQMAFSERS
jgi:hypothetical protein